MQYDEEEDDSLVIVIAPSEVSTRIARSEWERNVVAFRSLDDLDRWRRAQASTGTNIRGDVMTALSEIGFDLERLSSKLRDTFEAFARRKSVPAVVDVERLCASRRSLYRMWKRELREAPSQFLRRVRVVHAERLMNDGISAKQAALRAGFGSVNCLRRLLARRRSALSQNAT